MSIDTHKKTSHGYSLSLYQTPDDVLDEHGNPVRPQCRYAATRDEENYYDSAQQDKCFIIEDAPDIDDRKINALFANTSNRMYQDKNSRFRSSGTTATLTHLDTQGMLTIAYAGDSPVNLYVREKESGQIVQSLRMTEDHCAKNGNEVARVRAAGAFFDESGYLNGTVMVTRALGDTGVFSLSDEPEIRRYDLSQHLKNGQYEVIITTETDGAMERTGQWADQAEAQRLANIEFTEEDTHYGRILGQLAEYGGATDNVTSCALTFDRLPDHNVMTCVFDGHGANGGAASGIAADTFESKLNAYKLDHAVKMDVLHSSALPAGYTEGYDDAAAMRTIQSSKDVWRAVERFYPARTEYHAFLELLDTEEERTALKSALATQNISFSEDTIKSFGGMQILVLNDYDSMDELERVLEGRQKPPPPEPMPPTEPMTDYTEPEAEPVPQTERGFRLDPSAIIDVKDDGIYGAYKSYVDYEHSDSGLDTEDVTGPQTRRFGTGVVLTEIFSKESAPKDPPAVTAPEEKKKITPQPCIFVGKPPSG